jgi:hypothetical protein
VKPVQIKEKKAKIRQQASHEPRRGESSVLVQGWTERGWTEHGAELGGVGLPAMKENAGVGGLGGGG